MKNKSLKDPFTRVGDKFFDHNKDGKLDFWETMERDAQIIFDENMRKQSEGKSKYSPSDTHIPNAYTSNLKDDTEKTPKVPQKIEDQSCLKLFLALVLIIVGWILFFAVDSTILRVIVLFGSAGFGIALLKSGNFM